MYTSSGLYLLQDPKEILNCAFFESVTPDMRPPYIPDETHDESSSESGEMSEYSINDINWQEATNFSETIGKLSAFSFSGYTFAEIS